MIGHLDLSFAYPHEKCVEADLGAAGHRAARTHIVAGLMPGTVDDAVANRGVGQSRQLAAMGDSIVLFTLAQVSHHERDAATDVVQREQFAVQVDDQDLVVSGLHHVSGADGQVLVVTHGNVVVHRTILPHAGVNCSPRSLGNPDRGRDNSRPQGTCPGRTMNDKSELLAELRIERRAEEPARKRNWLVFLVVLVLVAASAGGWLWLQRETAWPVLTAAATAPPSEAAASVLDGSGYVTARRLATVSSKVTGKVVEVLIEEGMNVTEGQLLARLDAASETADFRLAEARLAAARSAVQETRVLLADARRTLGRTEDLRDQELVSEAELDGARAQVDALDARLQAVEREVEVAQRAVAVQQQRLDDTEIRAPFSGVVIAKAAQPGEMISPISAGGGFTRTGIGTIVDMDSLEIEVDVNEAYIQRVTPGQRVTAVLDAYPEWQIPASVIAIIPAADRQKATVRVRIGFDALDSRILPDMGVRVSFLTAEGGERRAATGVLVAERAVRQDQGASVVYTVVDGRARRAAVRTEGRVGDQVMVTAGLSAGQRVILDPPAELNDGDAVIVQTTQSKEGS